MRPRPDAIRPRSRPRPVRVRPRPNDLVSRPRGLNITSLLICAWVELIMLCIFYHAIAVSWPTG